MSAKAHILKADDSANIQTAADILREGGIVAFPTETVYGLGADALNAKAVCRVFEAKKRPSFDPLIVHVASLDEAFSLWREIPEIALKLAKRFWPGPLTLVLPKKDIVPDVVTAGLETVAVRMPAHPAALELIRKLGRPIAAPSANLFGYTSPTAAAAVEEDLGEGVDLILDGGPAHVGVESTVLKVEGRQCLLLRPGGVSVEELEKVAPVVMKKESILARPESPGQLESHYAPWTPLTLMDRPFEEFLKEMERLERVYRKKKAAWPRIGFLAFDKKDEGHRFEAVETLSGSADLKEAAANLFRGMRRLDKMNLDFIVAEPVPAHGIGLAVMDRLKKASAGRTGLKDFIKEEED